MADQASLDNAPAPGPDRAGRVVLIEAVVVAVALVLVYLTLRATDLLVLGAFNDDGAYASIGAAIARGKGYRLLHLVGEPVAVKFPPGLPALLALVWAAGGTPATIRTTVGILHPLLCGAAAAGLWWIGRRRLGVSRVTLAVLAIGPMLLDPAIEYYNIALSEPYFVAGWVAALLLTDRLVARSRESAGPRSGIALGLGLTLALTALFRSAALALVPAMLVALLARRADRREVIACAIGALLPLLAWSLLHAHLMAQGPLSDVPDETTYWSWLPLDHPARLVPFVLRAVTSNATAYAYGLSVLLADSPLPGALAVLAGTAALVFGAVRLFQRWPELVLTVAAALGAVLLWPSAQDRLLLPVLPFAGLLAAGGIQSLLTRGPPKLRTAVPAALGVVALLVGFRQQRMRVASEQAALANAPLPLVNVSPRYILLRNSRYIIWLAAWARTHTSIGDHLIVPFPGALFLHTGRKTIPAAPADPDFAPSAFTVPGRYLARRIVADSGTIIAIPSGVLLVAKDIAAIEAGCPGLLQWVGVGRPGSYPAMYRVGADRACVRQFVGTPP